MEWKEKPKIKGKFTDIINDPVAAELFSSGWCNLDCNYCYIPKEDNFLKSLHSKIIESVKDGTLLNNLYETYGENLKAISHWGTEPSLTLPHFHNFYKEALKLFPKLDTVKWSSNFMTPPKNTTEFIKSLSNERQVNISIQISLDGPPTITDENRRQGNTKKIVNNFIEMVKELQSFEFTHTIFFHFKPTIAKHQYEWVINNIYDYYKYFDDLLDTVLKINQKKNVRFAFACNPTIVCPQDYVKQDGINFERLYDSQMELQNNNDFKYVIPDSNYYGRFKRMKFLNEYFVKQKMFTCSAGDSQYGIDHIGNVTWCHDHFYHSHKEYKEACLNDHSRLQDNSIKTIDLINKKHINTLKEKEKEKIHKMLTIREFHDFSKHKIATSVTIIKELEQCGLISNIYKNDKMAELLAIYSNMAHSCPTNSINRNGSFYIPEMAYFKLLGNDIFSKFVKRYIEENE